MTVRLAGSKTLSNVFSFAWATSGTFTANVATGAAHTFDTASAMTAGYIVSFASGGAQLAGVTWEGCFQADDGSVTACGFGFLSDPDTGFNLGAVGQINVVSAGTTRFTVASNVITGPTGLILRAQAGAGPLIESDMRSTAGSACVVRSLQGLDVTLTGGNVNLLSVANGFAPTSGAATFRPISVTPTINQTGSASGDIACLYVNPTLTAVLGTCYGIHVDNTISRFDGDGTHVFELPADATDPTSGGGAATGRIPVSIGGSTRYLAYY